MKFLLNKFKWQWLGVFLLALAGLAVLVLYLRMIDYPSRNHGIPDSVQWYLEQHQITPDENRLYDLRSFIDREWLWQARMTPQEVTLFTEALQAAELSTASDVPEQFFDMPPYWWRPQLNPSVTTYGTPGFPVEQRGPDGLHLLLLYDTESETLYAWVKDNF